MSTRLRDSLAEARAQLAHIIPAGEAEREARLLLCHVLGLSSAHLLSRLDDEWPSQAPRERFFAALALREKRQPLSQILGNWDFYGRAFHVTPDTLTPRPDTETLIDHALSVTFERCLDLGTGTGAIAVTLLAERPSATGTATDISPAALNVARRNAEAHGVADRLAFAEADWFNGVEGRFDLIASNPPYVDAATYATLQPEVTDWEPREALTPGGDGLAPYRILADQAADYLTPGGRLIVEIGHDQGEAVTALFRNAGLTGVQLHPDLAGKDRVVVAHNA